MAKSARCVNTKDFNLADICGTYKTVSTQALIVKLNPVIKGWANYFSTVVSKQIFSQLDDLLGRRLGRWGSRRHPNKPGKWVKKKYFSNVKDTRNWIFNDGEYVLSQHSDVPIVRHAKVKGNKSPYDGDWTYWSSRISKHPSVRKEVITLLKKQKGRCEFCGLNFRPTDLIEVDHVIPRSEGGSNSLMNKQLLYRHCYDSKTTRDMKVVNH